MNDFASLWTEASHDVDAEYHERARARATAAIGEIWPFVALAQSEAEYAHRKALAADSIQTIALRADVQPGVVEEILDHHFTAVLQARTAAEEEDEGEDEGVEREPCKCGRAGCTCSGDCDCPPGCTCPKCAQGEAPEGQSKESKRISYAMIRRALEEGQDPLAWVPQTTPSAPGGAERPDSHTTQYSGDGSYSEVPMGPLSGPSDDIFYQPNSGDAGATELESQSSPRPPAPKVSGRRKTAVEDEEIWKGLNLPTSEEGQREISQQKGRDLADALMKPFFDQFGGEEGYRAHRTNEDMMDLKRRYGDENGQSRHPDASFGFNDPDDPGSEAYYQIKHRDPQGRDTGWRIRHYADGPNAEITHAATPGESHDMIDLGDWSSQGHRLPEMFGHDDLKRELDHWHSGDPEETGGTREYMEGQYGDPRIRRWKQRHLGRRTAATDSTTQVTDTAPTTDGTSAGGAGAGVGAGGGQIPMTTKPAQMPGGAPSAQTSGGGMGGMGAMPPVGMGMGMAPGGMAGAGAMGMTPMPGAATQPQLNDPIASGVSNMAARIRRDNPHLSEATARRVARKALRRIMAAGDPYDEDNVNYTGPGPAGEDEDKGGGGHLGEDLMGARLLTKVLPAVL